MQSTDNTTAAHARWATSALVSCPIKDTEGERRELCKACGYARRGAGLGIIGCEAAGVLRVWEPSDDENDQPRRLDPVTARYMTTND